MTVVENAISQRPSDAHKLGFPAMDDTHAEFLGLINALRAARDVDFLPCLNKLLMHTEEHFAEEERWMASSSFPAAACHADDHRAVLNSVREVVDFLAGGGAVAPCRPLAAALAAWFPSHSDYLDASLAQWMVKRRLGGKPVVLKRDAIRSSEMLDSYQETDYGMDDYRTHER